MEDSRIDNEIEINNRLKRKVYEFSFIENNNNIVKPSAIFFLVRSYLKEKNALEFKEWYFKSEYYNQPTKLKTLMKKFNKRKQI